MTKQYVKHEFLQFFFNILTARKAKDVKKSPPKKLKMESEESSDDEEVVKFKGKRKISAIVDSDSDYEYENDENESDNSQQMDVDDVKPQTKAANGKPAAKKKIKLDSDSATVSFKDKLKANIDESRGLSDVQEKDNTDIVDVPIVWRHQKLEFLKPNEIRDANKRKPDDPKYDPTTLYVPKEYLDSLTPVGIH